MRQKSVRALIGTVTGLALTMTFVPVPAEAHCQIPCGIYGDEMRFQMLEEHVNDGDRDRLVDEFVAEIEAAAGTTGSGGSQGGLH